jgi:formylglycine-generating enzyme required for sulfatase activity
VEQPPVSAWDDAYVATAGTGEKIPHPLSRKTLASALPDGTFVNVPEGMVYVPPGEFTMGSNAANMIGYGFGPAHEVWLDGYYIGKYEVTNAQWQAFADATGYVPLPKHWPDGKIPEGRENHPVVNVSWEDTQKYCEWVGKQTGQDVRLPTEAQWEKAARGPKGYSEYPWGNTWDYTACNNGELVLRNSGFQPTDPGDDFERKWRELESSPKGKEIASLGGYTMPVGSFRQDRSGYGCYDMAGNVRERCSDWYKSFYYTPMPTKNPQGPNEAEADLGKTGEGKRKSTRGSEWRHNLYSCRVINRAAVSLAQRQGTLGFRIVVLPRVSVRAAAAPAVDDAFLKEVAALPAEQQVARVVAKLKELNPGYDRKEEHKIENGLVTELHFSTVAVADISPVRALAGLKKLWCERAEPAGGEDPRGLLTDLSPLRGLKLEELRCSRNKFTDLSPLTGMPLTHFHCFYGEIADLGPLAGMPLRYFSVGGNRIRDLSPLRGMPLEELRCQEVQVKDISPLAGMALKRLRLFHTAVSDLTPLRGMPLTSLSVRLTKVRDLTPLQGMLLVSLECNETAVSDLSPLGDAPLQSLLCDAAVAVQPANAKVLRSIRTLEKINDLPAAEFWKRVEAGEYK